VGEHSTLMSTKVDGSFALGDKTARDMDHLYHVAEWILIVIMGVNGNELREKNLLARGYEFGCTLAADSPAEALTLYREQPNVKVPQPG
jgi:hypothetical protein